MTTATAITTPHNKTRTPHHQHNTSSLHNIIHTSPHHHSAAPFHTPKPLLKRNHAATIANAAAGAATANGTVNTSSSSYRYSTIKKPSTSSALRTIPPSTPYSHDLLCPVCTSAYSIPLELVCGHSLCSQCTREWSLVCQKKAVEQQRTHVTLVGLQDHESVLETAPNTEASMIEAVAAVDQTELCSVCMMEDDLDDPLICCDGCDVWTHKCCYGLLVLPDADEPWYCDSCADRQRATKRTCSVCPNTQDKAYKKTSDGQWIHVSCAYWIPTLSFGDELTRTPVLGRVEPERRKLICSICSKRGACVQCSYGRCTTAYHVPCAMRAGLRFEIRQLTASDSQTFAFQHSLCFRHYDRSSEIDTVNTSGAEFDELRAMDKRQRRLEAHAANHVELSCPVCRGISDVDLNDKHLGLHINQRLQAAVHARKAQLLDELEIAPNSTSKAPPSTQLSTRSAPRFNGATPARRRSSGHDISALLIPQTPSAFRTTLRVPATPDNVALAPIETEIADLAVAVLPRLDLLKLSESLSNFRCLQCEADEIETQKDILLYCSECTAILCEQCSAAAHGVVTRRNSASTHRLETLTSKQQWRDYVLHRAGVPLEHAEKLVNEDAVQHWQQQIDEARNLVSLRLQLAEEYVRRQFGAVRRYLDAQQNAVSATLSEAAQNDRRFLARLTSGLALMSGQKLNINIDGDGEPNDVNAADFNDEILTESMALPAGEMSDEVVQMKLDVLTTPIILNIEPVLQSIVDCTLLRDDADDADENVNNVAMQEAT